MRRWPDVRLTLGSLFIAERPMSSDTSRVRLSRPIQPRSSLQEGSTLSGRAKRQMIPVHTKIFSLPSE